MNDDSPNMQNEFFNRARRETSPVTIYLTNGKKLSGRIKAFDRFTVILQTNKIDQMIFKHAISTVSLGGAPSSQRGRDLAASHVSSVSESSGPEEEAES